MDASLTPGIACLSNRLGEGHGRRLLLLATGVEAEVGLAAELAGRGWAVSVCCRRADQVARAREATESAGVVVDWRLGRPEALPLPEGVCAVVACGTDPGLADERTCLELARVLRPGGLLLVALPSAPPLAPSLVSSDVAPAGFSATAVSGRDGIALLSARRAE